VTELNFRWPDTPTLSRRLRLLTGVDERLLDEVPSERPKYTAMGGVVLGTATIATFSMLVGLSEALGGFTLLLLVPAVIWGAFILNLDRWLIASATTTAWTKRASLLIPRLLVAACFGVVIAEPLVLRVFEPAIEQHIRDERDQSLRDLTSVLLRCNPEPDADAAALTAAEQPACAGHRMNLLADHATVSRELTGLQKDAGTLRESIKEDTDEQARRDAVASGECVGTTGPGLSGKAGRGPECLSREREAEEFRRTHPVTDRADRLAGLERQITELGSKLADAQRNYRQTRDAEVQRQVDAEASHQGPIGLLERLSALDELTAENGFLVAATWFIRGFLILVDCLPVLVKLLGGTTRYEQLLELRLNSGQKIFQQRVRTDEVRAVSALENEQHELRNVADTRRATSDAQRRSAEARLQSELDDEVVVLASRLKRKNLFDTPPGGEASADVVNGKQPHAMT
jgi:hypothetical protein